MSRPAIAVDSLSKAYRIGLKELIPDTLVGAAKSWLQAPLRNLQSLRALNTFRQSGQDHPGIIWALRDVSFDVAEGEVLGFIGRNGAGKSTLLKILSRITEPTRGRAVVRGRVSSLLEVGTGFHPELSGRDNIYMNGSILGMRKAEINRKFDQIVGFSGIEKFLDTPVKRYSSGMRVRLAFSVAAHLEPEILMIDEVLAVGDAEFQKKCLGKMHDVARGGRTVLFVSHNMSAIRSLTTKCVFLKNGRLMTLAETNVAIQAYQSDCFGEAGSPTGGLDYFRKYHHERPARIDAISVFGVDSPVSTLPLLSVGTPVTLIFRIQATSPVTRAIIKLVLIRQPDMVVSTVLSSDQDQYFELPVGGNEIHCRISEITLAPGTYSATAAITLDPNHRSMDVVTDVPVFEVSKISTARLNTEWPNRDWGSIVLRSVEWQGPRPQIDPQPAQQSS